RARSRELLAGDHRRSGFTDGNRDRVRRKTLHRPPRPPPPPPSRRAGSRGPPAADHPRRRGLLNPPHRKCSAKPPTRRGLTCLFSYLVNRTVEDGFGVPCCFSAVVSRAISIASRRSPDERLAKIGSVSADQVLGEPILRI